MADQIPLRIVTVSGEPFIGEFQSGDTVGVVHGGTGTSSIAGLKTALDYNLTGLDDVAVGFPDALSANQIIVWNGTAWVNEYNDKTEMRVRNGTASAMSRGDVIAVESAQNANLINVILADASQTSAMPAIGILEQDLAVGEEGIAITFGKVQGVNTSGLAEGEIVYVSPTTPGGVTDIKPTHDHYLIQNIGIVMRTNTVNGVIKVTGVGRSNDIPNANITTASGDADYIYIDDGGVFKKITPANLGVGSGGGGGGGGESVTDHGALTGLSDDDHPQYVLSATNNTLSSNVSNHIASGSVHFTEASIDHGSIAGLGDNDHPQYVLSATNNNLSSLVTSVETSTVSLSSYIAANETTWSTDNDTTDHTALSNIGTNTHAQIDSHIASGSVHFTEASIDHGSIAGLGDNDHPQYVLSATNNALSSLVTSVETSTVSLSSYIAANETTWSTDNDTTDHTALSNIGTNTHAQIDTHISNHTTSATTWNGTYQTVFDNSGSWGGGGGVTDHGALTGLADDDHTQYARVDGTRNLQTQTISDTYTGTIGDTSIGYGIETSGNLTNKAGNYLLLSATTGYQFRSPTVTFTDTDFPTTLGRIPSFKDSGILIKNTGTDDINTTGAVVPMDAEELSYGAAATDYSYTAGNAYVTINTAGTYEVTVSVGYTSTVQRWNGRLEIYKNSSGGTPNTWIGYGSSKMGYLRAASGHNEASLIITLPVTVTAGTTIAGWVEREAANGTCTLVANETYMSIKRLD